MSGLRCFKCGDGHTPLYCLNCANEMNRRDAKSAERDKASAPGPCSAYWPLGKHLADNHGLMLVDSECEDIVQVVDQMLMRRLDETVANMQKNIRLVDTKLRLMTETLQRIANPGKNSTIDRRCARSTLSFLEALTDKP